MAAPALLDTSKVVVGASGSGKTVTAKHDVEQLLGERRHVAIVDPTGVWWGMRSSPDGDGPGFDLPIFGGAHGDLPIRPTDGAAIARIIVEQRVSAIVDLSSIDNSRDWRWFMNDFVAGLRKLVAGNFHLVVDEADEFAAERAADDVGFSLRENLVWIAKRGRAQGFVPTWITQRTAEIAKAVISQAQTIVAHQLIAPSDRKAIDDYLKGHGSAEARKEVMESLAELRIGERWIYSPRLGILERGVTPALATFDSSRTPAPGEQLVEPRTLAQLDVSAIRAALAPAEPPPEDSIPADPVEAFAKGGEVGAMIQERVERIAALERENAGLRETLEELRGVDQECEGYQAGLRAIAALVDAVCNGAPLPATVAGDANEVAAEAEASGSSQEADHVDRSAERATNSTKAAATGGSAAATDAAVRGRRALKALAEIHPARLSEPQWATLAGYAKTGGTWGTYKSALRAAGLIEQLADRSWQATVAGVAAAGVRPVRLPALGPERAKLWGVKIPGVRRMVDVLAKRWPHFTTRESLAADLGMAASGGTFGTYLGRLRANGLLEEQGKRVRLADDVMGKAR